MVFNYPAAIVRLKAKAKIILGIIVPNRIIIWQNSSKQKKVALSFDDGPHPQYTIKVLDALSQVGGKATFFLVGNSVKKHPDIALKISEMGHEIGCHSFTHRQILRNGIVDFDREIHATSKLFKQSIGVSAKLFRPPFGILNLKLLLYCWRKRITLAMWSIDTRDHEANDPKELYGNVIKHRIKSGDILLMHDNNEITVQFLRKYLVYLKSEGFSFVTISELINTK